MRALTRLSVVLVLLSGVEQAAHASAKSEWKALPPAIYKCMKKMVEAAEKAPLSKVIAAGISPHNPGYAPGMDTCKKFAAGPRKNFECTIQDQNGNNINTICNESFVIASDSSITKLSLDEALDRVIAGQQVQPYFEETPEGLKRRQKQLSSAIDARLRSGSYSVSELTGSCLELYNNWSAKSGAGAFAFSSSGACGALNEAPDQVEADKAALSACREKSGSAECFVIARIEKVAPTSDSVDATTKGIDEDNSQSQNNSTANTVSALCTSSLCEQCANTCGDKNISLCSQAIQAEPSNFINFYNRAAEWDRQNQFDKAIDDFSQAINLSPKDAWSYYARGVSWMKKGDIDRAIADAAKAVELDPSLEDAKKNLSVYQDIKSGKRKSWKYLATLSCGMGGLSNMNILACFSGGSTGIDTELSITRDGVQKLLKNYMIVNIQSTSGSIMLNANSDIPDGMIIDDDGLRILLPERFRIVAQNSQDKLVLGIKIENFGGKRSECTAEGDRIVNYLPEIIYQQEVGRYGVIAVGQ